MKDTERRRLEMFIRVREFMLAHAAAFPPTSFAGEQSTILSNAIDALETHTSAQTSGRGQVKESTLSKSAAHDEVIRDLAAISRTARAMAMTSPGVEGKFRVPHNQSFQTVLAAARAAAKDALAYKAEFIKRGLPANFLEDLQADTEALEEAITRQAQGEESHVSATAAIDNEIERGMMAVRELEPVVRNTFVNDRATLAAWTSASHVEKTPRRKTTAPPTPLGPTPPAS